LFIVADEKKGGNNMILKKTTLALLFSIGILGLEQGSVRAQADGILFKVQQPGTNYCHLKFPAIREETLSWSRPVLKDASQKGDIIDFYGPCDYDPTGKVAVQSQKIENQRRGSREYSD
jgi:hypothetical protein